MKKTALIAGLVVIVLVMLGATGAVQAQRRWVVVNGALQSPMDLALLDRHACTAIPNGSYWLNYNTGIWGYADDPRPRGHISAGCGQSGGSGQPSRAERGMLYSSQPWGRGR
jgi:hypothetical protein